MWSPEEEYFAGQFLNPIIYGRRTVLHDVGQLNHIETQIAKSQAGLTGESPVQLYSYTIKDVRSKREYPISSAVDRRFINGMITIARYLRRNVK